MAPRVVDLFVLEVEEAGDYVFEVAGIVFVYSNHKFQLYSTSANHNRYRAALNRFSFADLEKGIEWKGTEYRLKALEEEVKQEGWENPNGVPVLLQRIYQKNPRQMFFLKRHLQNE